MQKESGEATRLVSDPGIDAATGQAEPTILRRDAADEETVVPPMQTTIGTEMCKRFFERLHFAEINVKAGVDGGLLEISS